MFSKNAAREPVIRVPHFLAIQTFKNKTAHSAHFQHSRFASEYSKLIALNIRTFI